MPEELKIFKQKTEGHVVLMGRKTCENLPHLKNREIWCLTRNEKLDTSKWKNKVKIFTDTTGLTSAIWYANKDGKKVFCAGGAKVLDWVSEHFYDDIKRYHISIIKEEYKCDTFWKFHLPCHRNFVSLERIETKDFTHNSYEMVDFRNRPKEYYYLDLLKTTLYEAFPREGRNGKVKSLFGKSLEFDLTEGFPLLTTKRMFWRGIVEELLFFIKGYTDSKLLEEKNIKIWKGNTERKFLDENGFENRKEGIMGPMYGWQWRNFGGEYDKDSKDNKKVKRKGVDQLEYIIREIKNNPTSRRIIMTDYNPAQAKEGVLFPCHSLIIQFYVDGDYLDMTCYNRSQDLFLGTPFNIASSALLLSIIAKITNKTARKLHMFLGDVHIYEEHFEAVKTQLKRTPFYPPKLEIKKKLENLKDIEELVYGRF